MQERLKAVNQQLFKLKNAEIQSRIEEEKKEAEKDVVTSAKKKEK